MVTDCVLLWYRSRGAEFPNDESNAEPEETFSPMLRRLSGTGKKPFGWLIVPDGAALINHSRGCCWEIRAAGVFPAGRGRCPRRIKIIDWLLLSQIIQNACKTVKSICLVRRSMKVKSLKAYRKGSFSCSTSAQVLTIVDLRQKVLVLSAV